MTGARAILTTFLAISFVVMILLGFQDKFDQKALCKSAQGSQIDKCARTGGLSR